MAEDSVRLAILEKSQENSEKEMSALREAISEISKVNIRISELLAVHQLRLDQQQQKEEDLNRKVETGITNLTKKMDVDRDEIYKKMDTNRSDVLKAFDDLKKDFDNVKGRVLIGVGIFLALQGILTIFGPTIVANMTTKVVLTNPHTPARIQTP
jgi:phage gp29-like protein